MQTFTGIEYLKIDIASQFGLDKKDWDDRIAWVDDNEDHLEDHLNEAEEPALYFAAVQAYRKTQRGEPTGHAISLDAASSGLQILACLAGCRASAELCGVVPTGHREDAYTTVFEAVRELTPGSDIVRADCKKAVMTSLYGSTAEPRRVFGKGDQLRAFYQVMESRLPGAWEVNKGLEALWQPYALSHDWVLPDNFHVHVRVEETTSKFVQVLNQPVPVYLKENRGTKEGKSLGPNIVHSIDGMIVREMHARCTYDPQQIQNLKTIFSQDHSEEPGTSTGRYKDEMVQKLWGYYQLSGFLSVRIFQFLDEKNFGLVDGAAINQLIQTLPEKPFPLISIHDCFRCHPNYANDMRRTYNRLLSELAASQMLFFIASQIVKRPLKINKMGDISQDILSADYTLC